MASKLAIALVAAATILPASLAMTSPVMAQRGYAQTYTDRSGEYYGQYRRGTSFDEQGVPGRSSGVGVGSEACSDPSYQMDPRCYSNR